MKEPVIIMNLSGAYELEPFANNPDFIQLDCSHISGTDCYCSQEAAKAITKIIAPYTYRGIHFIDNGDYHYLSKFWTDKIDRKFTLVLFDHHTDMQPSLIPGFLSCGNWVQVTADQNPSFKKVIIIGASGKAVRDIPKNYLKRVVYFSRGKLRQILSTTRNIKIKGPIYISIDKDVLSTLFVHTNWDQGSLTLRELQLALSLLLSQNDVLGIDLCGEFAIKQDLFQNHKAAYIDSQVNLSLLKTIINVKENQKNN